MQTAEDLDQSTLLEWCILTKGCDKKHSQMGVLLKTAREGCRIQCSSHIYCVTTRSAKLTTSSSGGSSRSASKLGGA